MPDANSSAPSRDETAGPSDASSPGAASQGSGLDITPATPEEWQAFRETTLKQLEEEDVPIIRIGDSEVPLYSGLSEHPVWALFNLLCTAATLVLAVWGMLRRRLHRRPRATADGNHWSAGIGFRKPLHWLGVLVGPASAVIFLLTENMRKLMTVFDGWSVLMALLLAAQVLFFAFSRTGRHGTEDGAQPPESAAD